jgi:hypothetical protein
VYFKYINYNYKIATNLSIDYRNLTVPKLCNTTTANTFNDSVSLSVFLNKLGGLTSNEQGYLQSFFEYRPEIVVSPRNTLYREEKMEETPVSRTSYDSINKSTKRMLKQVKKANEMSPPRDSMEIEEQSWIRNEQLREKRGGIGAKRVRINDANKKPIFIPCDKNHECYSGCCTGNREYYEELKLNKIIEMRNLKGRELTVFEEQEIIEKIPDKFCGPPKFCG